MAMSIQLPLDLEQPTPYGRDSFVATPALQPVLATLLAPETWLSPHLILSGPDGSGKTHLGHIFAEAHGARFIPAAETFGMTNFSGSVVVDDAENASEEALFHLSNRTQSSGQHLVLLTKMHPQVWRPNLPDLASRLRAMRLVNVPEPDDVLLLEILKKLFSQRFISPSDDALDYLARRMERSVAAAQKIVTELEQSANGRPFNRALVRDVFEASGQLFDDGENSDSF